MSAVSKGRNPWASQTLVILRQIQESEASPPRGRDEDQGLVAQGPLVPGPGPTLCCASLPGPWDQHAAHVGCLPVPAGAPGW